MDNVTPQLFYENIHDAAREVVRALGGGKAVGHLLWKSKPVGEAQTRLSNCLDPNRPEKLSPEELILLMSEGRKAGCHAIMFYVAEQCGYTRPSPLAPQDEAEELQRKFIEAVQQSRILADRLERLTKPPLSAVK